MLTVLLLILLDLELVNLITNSCSNFILNKKDLYPTQNSKSNQPPTQTKALNPSSEGWLSLLGLHPLLLRESGPSFFSFYHEGFW